MLAFSSLMFSLGAGFLCQGDMYMRINVVQVKYPSCKFKCIRTNVTVATKDHNVTFSC